MSNQKEIWHLWNGRGKIPSMVKSVLFRNGMVANGEAGDFAWSHHGKWRLDLVAYTQGNTRPSKRNTR